MVTLFPQDILAMAMRLRHWSHSSKLGVQSTEGLAMTSATINAKGQVTIPADVRNALGVVTGDRIEFILGPRQPAAQGCQP